MTRNIELLAALESLTRDELRDLAYTLIAVGSKSTVIQIGLALVANGMTAEELGPGEAVMEKMVKFTDRRQVERN
jgi:hypothetical protein